MPELPEVETTRRTVNRVLTGKIIAQVLPDHDDRIVFDRASPEAFAQALEGARVTGTGRKGKYFWLTLDRRPWPVIHLGMTGEVIVRRKGRKSFTKTWGDTGNKLWNEGDRAAGKVLPFCRLRVIMTDGTELAYTDPRRFGRLRLAQDPLHEPPISDLGFDPLLEFPSAKKLAAILAKRKAPIKAVLLDQSLFAGVGNWIADEVLYQARLSPHRLAAKLTSAEVVRLRIKLLSIIRFSVSKGADYDRYPKSWLFHHRWGRDPEAMTSKKLRIVHDTIGGRTSAWVPAHQF